MSIRASAFRIKRREAALLQEPLVIGLCFIVFFAVASTLLSALVLERQEWEGQQKQQQNSNSKFETRQGEYQHDQFKSESYSNVYLGGMILDASVIQSQVWFTMMKLNCLHNVGVHILTQRGMEEARETRERIQGEYYLEGHDCANFIIQGQENIQLELESMTNRIDRLSALRDFHRSQLQNSFEASTRSSSTTDSSKIRSHDIVMLMDLDLHRIPPVKDLITQIERLQEPKATYPHDAICAAGVTMANAKKVEGTQEPWYYDTFATVLLPDTFTHPLQRRLQKDFYKGEDPNFVRSNDRFGNFTQGDLMRHFIEEGKISSTRVVGVRSCFSGIAMYRASYYFEPRCHYRLSADESIMRYASEKEERPCEHVVFHDCLLDHDPAFDLAVNPNLITLWRRQ
jgi:hypothetical protein